ncbi:conjugal transfer protein TraB (plasmid) [Nitrobacteraceae bacterium UC4446_H13]
MTRATLGQCPTEDSSVSPGQSPHSIRDAVQTGALIVGAAASGTLGWIGVTMALPLALAFPALWGAARTRAVAIMVSAAYFLAASRGLPQGVATFYGSSIVLGGALWIAAATVFVAIYGLLWSAPGWGRVGRFALASTLMAVPPFGIVGWAHPLTAAGALFPGWGWLGLGVAAAAMLALTTRLWPGLSVIIAGAWLWSAAGWASPPVLADWRGVDTAMGASLGHAGDLEPQRALLRLVRREAEAGADVVVLPESALGLWTPTVSRFWIDALRTTPIVVIAGAAVVDRDGYDNVLIEIAAGRAQTLYYERMPIPVSMWQPWLSWIGESGSAQAHLFANPTVISHRRRIAPLICYEQLLIWPVLHSMMHAPDVLLGVGNGWWATGTSVIRIQHANVEAWARLFAVPLVLAFNQ